MDKPIIIEIDWIKIIIEKGEERKTAPKFQPPIQYNTLNIKRKYYKKTDPMYHRNPNGFSIQRQQIGITKTTSKFLKFDKTVQQEPLLDPYC